MKKIFKNIAIALVLIIVVIAGAGMYKFNYLAGLDGYDVDGNKITMDKSYDLDNDGINDCEKDGTCDDSVDYSTKK